MIKKLLKWMCVCVVVLLVLLAAGGFVLYKMYPPARLKLMVQQYVADNFHRELVFDDISFTWIGFTLTNAALSENSTFAQGTFIKADKLTAHVAVKPLFQKRVEIDTLEADGLQVNIIQQKDGTFNFDTLFAASTDTPASPETTTQETAEQPLVVTAQQILLRDCDIDYQNEQTGLRTDVKDLNIDIRHFDLANPFEVLVSFTTNVSGQGQPDMNIPVQIALKTFLANLDLPRASVSITKASAAYQTVQLNLTGEISNFENPSVNLSGSLTGISNRAFAAFAPNLPNFRLPAISLDLQAQADIQQSVAEITKARLAVQDSFLSASGTVDWGRAVPAYNVAASLQANIGQIVQMTDTLDGFSPAGVISGRFNATQKKQNQDVSGTVTLKNLSAYYAPVTLTQTNGTVTLKSLADISAAINGKLNDEKFTLSFSYQEMQNVLNLVLNLNLDKLVLKTFPSSQTNEPQPAQQQEAAATSKNSQKMNVQANVTVGGIDIPYLQSDGFTLAANLANITDTMAQTNGTVSFALQPGKITNLDDFIKDSKVAKIILLPVAIVKKVAGFLQIDLFPAEKSPHGTTLSFTQAQGQYTFTNGVMNLDKTVFTSSVTQLTASGTADFTTQALDMKAKATLLTQAVPVAIKITGTFNEPKGKLDVVNTVTSVVGGVLNGTAVKSVAQTGVDATTGTAKLATDTVKDTVNTAADLVKGIGGLFKKKKTEE